MLDLPTRDPLTCSSDDLDWPSSLTLTFNGFTEETFAVLDRLKATPNITQYREDKPAIESTLKEPFKAFRDDLVVNWVLPNRLDYETERHVFSRLLKNDFGAGGCHHHKWMAFYRPSYRRLTDLQLSHSLSPEGMTTGLFVGEYGTSLLATALEHTEQQPVLFLKTVNTLLEEEGWAFGFYTGQGKTKERHLTSEPLPTIPEDLSAARGLWARKLIPRAEVCTLGPELVTRSLDRVHRLWPLYRFLGGHA